MCSKEQGFYQSNASEVCKTCRHEKKYHDFGLCAGAFPNGVEGIDPQEVFYGECHCPKFENQGYSNYYRSNHTGGIRLL